jgi:hypothetical protein
MLANKQSIVFAKELASTGGLKLAVILTDLM